jgi:hypothetical protein
MSSSSSSSCCGQGMTNMMSQFQTASTAFSSINTKQHPHSTQTSTQTITPQIQTTQITPQTFSNTFTKRGFMKFSRPTTQ